MMMAKILVSAIGGRVAFEALLKFVAGQLPIHSFPPCAIRCSHHQPLINSGPLAATLGFTLVFWLVHLAGLELYEFLESIISTVFLSITMMLLTPLCHSLIDDVVQEKASKEGMLAKAVTKGKDVKTIEPKTKSFMPSFMRKTYKKADEGECKAHQTEEKKKK
jgi:hypothetical protein